MVDRSDSERGSIVPEEPIHRVVEPLVRFLHIEAAGGVVLLICTVAALANSPLSERFQSLWETQIGIGVDTFEFRHSLKHLINDGLMAIFFFVIGLEVKRELVLGELRDLRNTILPIAAALGGMVVPAAIYLAIQVGQPSQRGWGIVMATDIAFVVGCLAVLGNRVPRRLRVLLHSLAIADDIGAILVIAIGYTEQLSLAWLAVGLVAIGVVFGLARVGVRSFFVYTLVGALAWFAFHESGVHATIAGVILGLMTPARPYISEGQFRTILERARQVFRGEGWPSASHHTATVSSFRHMTRETISPLEYLENTLHPWVGFVIMPVFALANAGIAIHVADFGTPPAIAVMLGLVVGKPVGIVLFCWLAVQSGLAKLPAGVGWGTITGGGCLAGIGFTMALFIAGLALDEQLLDEAKIGILAGSLVSAILGITLLVFLLPKAGPQDRREAYRSTLQETER